VLEKAAPLWGTLYENERAACDDTPGTGG